MKKFFLFLLFLLINSINFTAFTQEDKPVKKVIVYYFHGTFRCPSCTKMQRYSQEAINNNFQDALKAGLLGFKTINIEEEGNEHFIDDYKLYTKSLILSLIQDKKEIKAKNLDKIWQFVGNKEKFLEYVTKEVRNFIKDL